MQEFLANEYHSDNMLKDKFLEACYGIEDCRLARQKVSETLDGVIENLCASIDTYEETRSE